MSEEGLLKRKFGRYFALHPSQEVREIFLATAIKDFAVAAVGVFEPIYLYRSGFSIEQVVLFYLVIYALYFFAAPLGGRICRKHGYEHTILFSSPFLVVYYLALFSVRAHPMAVIVAVIALVIRKTLFWPGYHANFATWMSRDEEGKEVSNRTAYSAVATSFAPAVGGAIIAAFGFSALFVFVSILILLSNVPLLRTPELFMPRDFPYREMMRRFFNPKAAKRFLSFVGYGEQLMAVALWPLFIVLLVPDLLAVGAIISVAKFVNVLVTLYVGGLTDEGPKKDVLKSGSLFTAASWFVRPFISGPLGVFLIDAYYGISKNVLVVPFASLLYDHARDGDIMVRIVFEEMSNALGKVAAAGLALAAFHFFPASPWTAVFLIAGAFSLLYMLMPASGSRPVTAEASRRSVAA